ncbi:3656_t:CDS:1, partial [Gigaspora margarita]
VRISVGEVEVIFREVDITYKDIRTTMKDMETMNEEISMINFVGSIEVMTKIFYKKEHVKKEGPIYLYDELQE